MLKMSKKPGVRELQDDRLRIRKEDRKDFKNDVKAYLSQGKTTLESIYAGRKDDSQQQFLKETLLIFIKSEGSRKYWRRTSAGKWQQPNGSEEDYAVDLKHLVMLWLTAENKGSPKKTPTKPQPKASSSRLDHYYKAKNPNLPSSSKAPASTVVQIADERESSSSSNNSVLQNSNRRDRITMYTIEDEDENLPDIPFQSNNVDEDNEDAEGSLPSLEEIMSSPPKRSMPLNIELSNQPSIANRLRNQDNRYPSVHVLEDEDNTTPARLDKGKRRADNVEDDSDNAESANHESPLAKKPRYTATIAEARISTTASPPPIRSPLTEQEGITFQSAPASPVVTAQTPKIVQSTHEDDPTIPLSAVKRDILDYIRQCKHANLARTRAQPSSAQTERYYRHFSAMMTLLESDLRSRVDAIARGEANEWKHDQCLWECQYRHFTDS